MKQFLFFFLTILSFVSHSQETPFHYFNGAGVQNESIYCTEQDEEGRLLLGTQRGLMRYNGFTSKRIPMLNETNREIKQIFSTKKGVFATNSHGELFYMKNDTLKQFLVKGFNAEVMWLETEGDYVKLYTKKEEVVVHIRKKTISNKTVFMYAEETGVYVKVFSGTSHEQFHVTSNGELILPKQQEARSVPFLNSAVKYSASVGNAIVLTTDLYTQNGMVAYSNGQFRKLSMLPDRKKRHINQLKVVNGRLMVLTNDGCLVYSNGIMRTPSVWFTGIACTDIFEDKLGNCWVSTKSKGLILIPAGKHKKLINDGVSSISLNRKGELVLGTTNASIIRMYSNGRQLSKTTSDLFSDEVSFCAYDDYFKGYFFTNGFVSLNGDVSVLLSPRVHEFCRTKQGQLLIATSDGLFAYNQSSLEQWKKKVNDPQFRTPLVEGNCYLMNRNKTTDDIVVANFKGLFLVSNGSVKEIQKNREPIRATHAVWFQSSLYVVTSGNSLLEIKNGKVVNTRFLNQTEVINVLKLDASKTHLYLLTESGLYRTKKMHEKFESLKEVLGFDGLYIRDFCVKGDEVYLATQEGVFNYEWTHKKESGVHFVVGKPQNNNVKETAKKMFKTGNVVLPVECIDLTGFHAFHLQYRLVNEGVVGEWVEVVPGTERIPFPSLASGRYKVELRMIDPVSGSTTETQFRTFEILGSWYQLKLLWISVGVALVLGIQYVMKQLRPKPPVKKAKVAVQK